MTEDELLQKMVPPGRNRPGKYGSARGFGGVIQIIVTSTCDKACFGCTQASNLARPRWWMTPEQFEAAVRSLGFWERGTEPTSATYPGIVGVFGGNPALSPHFEAYCGILHKLVPFHQRGVWSNNPMTLDKAKTMAATFDPAVSNLNVHLDRHAYELFKQGWPESNVVGLTEDSRHSPPWVAMRDVVTKQERESDERPWETRAVPDDDRIRELISTCDINQHWSAMIGVFRGDLRAWFCEVAGAQAMLHQDEPDYPDTGIRILKETTAGRPMIEYEEADGAVHEVVTEVGVSWWKLPMERFKGQVRKHCWDCGVPLRGYGELAQADLVTGPRQSRCTCGADRTGPSAEAHADDCPENPKEQVSSTHADLYRPKRTGRRVEVVTDLVQLGTGRIEKVTKYLQNSHR